MVSALTNLTLLIEHETTAECVDFVLESDRRVALTALDCFSARVGDSFPVNAVSDDLGLDYFLAGIIVQASDHEKFVTASCHCSAFSRCRHPSLVYHILNVDSVTLTLLHPLDVSLKSTDKLVNQSIPGDVLGRRRCEFVFAIFVIRSGVFDDEPRPGPHVLNSSSNELRVWILTEEFACIGTDHEVRSSLRQCRLLSRVATTGASECTLSVHHCVGANDGAACMEVVVPMLLHLGRRVLEDVDLASVHWRPSGGHLQGIDGALPGVAGGGGK